MRLFKCSSVLSSRSFPRKLRKGYYGAAAASGSRSSKKSFAFACTTAIVLPMKILSLLICAPRITPSRTLVQLPKVETMAIGNANLLEV